MHRAEAGLRQADSREQRGVSHARTPGARFVIRAAPPSGEKAVTKSFDAGPGQRIGQRVRFRRDVGFEKLGEGVHAVRRHHLRRAARQQLGIDDGDARHQLFVAERFLETARPLPTQHGVLGGFRTGSGGRRNQDQRRRRAGIRPLGADALEVFHHRVPVRKQAGDRLRRVQRAAAADADHHVDASTGECGDRLVHQLRRRLARHRQVVTGDVRRAHGVQQRRPERRRAQRARAGDDQHACARNARPPSADRRARHRRRRCAAGGRWRTGRTASPLKPSGNKPRQETPCRGSAIISATASRQAR